MTRESESEGVDGPAALSSFKKKALGIRGQILGGILVVTLALASIALNDLRSAWMHFTDSRRIEAVNGYVNGLINAAKQYVLERGRVSVLLRDVYPPGKDDLAFVSEHRAAGNQSLDGVLSGLADMKDDDISPRVAEIAVLRGRVDELRAKVDSELARNPSQRTLSIVEFWFPAMTRLASESRTCRW